MFLEFSVAGLAPAALLVLAGMYVRARQADEKPALWWLFFLFSASVLLYGAQFLILRGEMYEVGGFWQPALIGTMVALFIHLGTTPKLWSRETIWMPLSTTVAVVALMIHWWIASDPLLLLISVITALAWQAWQWRARWRWLALLLILLVVCSWILNPNLVLMNSPKWLHDPLLLGILFVWPIVAVVLIARLVYASIANARPSNWPATVIRLAAAALLLLVIGEQIVTETVWVKAEDSLSMMPGILFIVAIAAAMLLAWALTGWRRLAALGFVLVLAITISFAYNLGWRLTPTSSTEARAAKIERAIHKYRERQGHYPSRLANLIPFYLWRIPQPMIFRDQTWCYQGGDDYYRLGYVHQPGFGWPIEELSIRIQAAVGEPPDPSWPCDDELENVKSQSPWQ